MGRESGVTLVEVMVTVALVAVLAIAALTFLGGAISAMMSTLGNAL